MVRLSKEAKEIGLALYAVSIDETKGINERFAFYDKASAPVVVLDKAGFVYFNDTMRNEGKTASVLSPAGIEHFKPLHEKAGKSNGAAGTTARAPAIDPTVLTIRKNIPIPAVAARSRRASAWPWEKFDIGDSIFIENTTERPQPVKSLASTVNTANRKFAKAFDEAKAAGTLEAGITAPRKFQIAAGDEGGKPGALVHRIA